jgi:hypothetical protein
MHDLNTNVMQIRAPGILIDAVKVAAKRDLSTTSQFVRQAVLEKLRAAGIDPIKPAGPR